MRRTGGLAVSTRYEVENARPELARPKGRIVFTANGIGPGRPIAAGEGRGRVTFIRPNSHLGALLKGREDIENFRVGRHANDNRMGIREQLRVLSLFARRIGDAGHRLAKRYLALKTRR